MPSKSAYLTLYFNWSRNTSSAHEKVSGESNIELIQFIMWFQYHEIFQLTREFDSGHGNPIGFLLNRPKNRKKD